MIEKTIRKTFMIFQFNEKDKKAFIDDAFATDHCDRVVFEKSNKGLYLYMRSDGDYGEMIDDGDVIVMDKRTGIISTYPKIPTEEEILNDHF